MQSCIIIIIIFAMHISQDPEIVRSRIRLRTISNPKALRCANTHLHPKILEIKNCAHGKIFDFPILTMCNVHIHISQPKLCVEFARSRIRLCTIWPFIFFGVKIFYFTKFHLHNIHILCISEATRNTKRYAYHQQEHLLRTVSNAFA